MNMSPLQLDLNDLENSSDLSDRLSDQSPGSDDESEDNDKAKKQNQLKVLKEELSKNQSKKSSD